MISNAQAKAREEMFFTDTVKKESKCKKTFPSTTKASKQCERLNGSIL